MVADQQDAFRRLHCNRQFAGYRTSRLINDYEIIDVVVNPDMPLSDTDACAGNQLSRPSVELVAIDPLRRQGVLDVSGYPCQRPNPSGFIWSDAIFRAEIRKQDGLRIRNFAFLGKSNAVVHVELGADSFIQFDHDRFEGFDIVLVTNVLEILELGFEMVNLLE